MADIRYIFMKHIKLILQLLQRLGFEVKILDVYLEHVGYRFKVITSIMYDKVLRYICVF